MKLLIVFLFFCSCQSYSTVDLERTSRTGYLPTEHTTVPYADSMKLGKRVWFDGKMWTVINLNK